MFISATRKVRKEAGLQQQNEADMKKETKN